MNVKRFLLFALCFLSILVPYPAQGTSEVDPSDGAALTARAFLPAITIVPAPKNQRYFSTLPPGSQLPGDAECAASVKPRTENKGVNAVYNRTRGNQRLANDFFTGGNPRANTEIATRVTGDFVGTTDEILQWAACKWGIDEDIVRAQAALESWWRQTNLGNWTTRSERCAPGHPLGADGRAGQCPEAFGVLQVKYYFFKSGWPSFNTSTAFNLDVAYAVWRACYEGYETWLNDVEHVGVYAAGDLWGCIGRWNQGRWHTAAAENYMDDVRIRINNRFWEKPEFQEP